jgi:hypothetical protein
MADWTSFPLSLRAQNALISYVGYIGKALWPSGLAVFYPHPKDEVSLPLSLAAGLALLLLTALAVRFARHTPYLPVGWFWYLAHWSPDRIVRSAQAMADRTPHSLISLRSPRPGASDLVGRSRSAKAVACAGRRRSPRWLRGFRRSHWCDGESPSATLCG